MTDAGGDTRDTRGRRSRIAAGVGAAMLVAAAGGLGFGIGRSLDDDGGDADVIVPGQETPTTDAPSEPAGAPAADTVPVAEPAADSTQDDPPSTDAVPDDQPADAGAVVLTDEGDGEGPAASGSAGWPVFSEPDMKLLVDRTTADEMLVRAHLGERWERPDDFGFPGGWQPPAWCYQDAHVRVSLAGGSPAIIDVGTVPWFDEPYLGRNVSWLTLGRAEGNPHRVVFVQAPDGATSVTATFGDGAVDSMAPQDGVAVLVVPGAPETIVHDDGYVTWLEEQPDFVVTFDGGGEPVTVAGNDVGSWDDPEFAGSCSPPPPELPEPGEQPADPAAAEADIIAVIDLLYGVNDVEADIADLVDDPTGVAEAQEQAAEGGYADTVDSVVVVVEELVFTTPEEAWYRYRLETDITDLRDRFGTAVYVEGSWKVTRATICQDVSLAGGSCGLPHVAPVVLPNN